MNEYKTIDPASISQVDLHNLLLTAVAPRPIALASTIDAEGRVNLSPFSFFNVFSSNPPVVILSPSRGGRDNNTKHTLDNVYEVPEVTINIVNFAMAQQMSLSSTAYAKGINEFTKSGLNAIPSDTVKPPRVAEAPVSFECIVEKIIPLGTEGGAGNLIIAKVIRIHVQTNCVTHGKLDTQKLDLIGRMGESWYIRCSDEALFQIPKPLTSLGIGVDRLPQHIRHSTLLTGNDLGILGNMPEHTDTQHVNSFYEEIKKMHPSLDYALLHQLIKHAIEQNDLEKARLLTFLSLDS